jgi:1-acyl-sn-glycerol-3-phosphate acyltransferase
MSSLRAIWRLSAASWLFIVLALTLPVIRLVSGTRWAHRFFLGWIGVMHRSLNLKVERIGDLPDEPSILLGNHPSYLDIFLCYDRRPTAIVAAREFKWFPFVGWAAQAIGAVWVHRKCPESRKQIVPYVIDAVKAQRSAFVFPEGRTTNGVLPTTVRVGMFKAAAEAGVPVTYVAIRYSTRKAAYYHDLKGGFVPHLLRHLWTLLREPQIKVSMRFSRPQLLTCPERGMRRFENFVRWHLRRDVPLRTAHAGFGADRF